MDVKKRITQVLKENDLEWARELAHNGDNVRFADKIKTSFIAHYSSIIADPMQSGTIEEGSSVPNKQMVYAVICSEDYATPGIMPKGFAAVMSFENDEFKFHRLNAKKEGPHFFATFDEMMAHLFNTITEQAQILAAKNIKEYQNAMRKFSTEWSNVRTQISIARKLKDAHTI